MRKRQWKKILSVVLALAMVFSMNVSAFAEPAAEFPETEPAVGDVYTATIGEATPSIAVDSTDDLAEAIALTVVDGESQPVTSGLTLTGRYTPEGGLESSDIDLTSKTIAEIVTEETLEAGDTIAVEVTEIAVNTNPVALPSPATATITLTAAAPTYTATIGESTPSIAVDSTDDLAEAIALTVVDGESQPVTSGLTLTGKYTPEGGLESSAIDLTSKTIAEIVTEETLEAGDTIAVEVTAIAVNTNPVALPSPATATITLTAAVPTYTSYIGKYNVDKDLESTDKLAEAIQLTVEDGEGNPVEDNLTLTGSYVVTKDGEAQVAVNDVDLAATTIASIVTAKSLAADDTIAVTVTDVEVNSVDATLPDPAVATITLTEIVPTEDETVINIAKGAYESYTVSGLSFTVYGKATGKITSANNAGIFTVKLDEGIMSIDSRDEVKPISINAAKDVLVDMGDLGNAKYASMSLQGAGDYFFDFNSTTRAEFESIDNTATISGNDAKNGRGLLISSNVASNPYQTLIAGVDSEKTPAATGKTIIYRVAQDNGILSETSDDLKANTTTVNATGYVLSGNSLFKMAAGSEVDLTKTKATDAIIYGSTVFQTVGDFEDPVGGFKFKTLKDRNVNTVTGVGFYTVDIGTDFAYFHVTAKTADYREGTSITTSATSPLRFALSTNSAAYEADVDNFKAVGGVSETGADDEKVYQLSTATHLVSAAADSAKKFYVTIINTDSAGYWSKPQIVGDVTLNSKKNLTLAVPATEVYADGQGLDEDGDVTNVLTSGKLIAALEGATVTPYGGVKVGKSTWVGNVTYYFLKTNEDPDVVNSFKNAQDTTEIAGVTNVITHTWDLVSGNYYARAMFTTDYADKEMYAAASSNTISFNIIPNPVKVSVKASTQTVAEKKNITVGAKDPANGVIEPEITYINLITEGANGGADVCDPNEFQGTPVYLEGSNILNNGSVSKNKGIYDYTVSTGSVEPKYKAPYSALYKIDWSKTEAGKLEVFGSAAVTTADLTIPYGTAKADITGGLSKKLNSTGTEEDLKEGYVVNYYDKKWISGNGLSTNAPGNEMSEADILKVPASDYMLAQIVYTGSKKTDSEAIKSNVAKVTVEKRPIVLSENGVVGLHSKRNKELTDADITISGADLAKVGGLAVKNEKFPYSGTDDISKPLSDNTTAVLNKSDINIKIADTYDVRIATYTLKPEIDKNFAVAAATAKYKVDGAWYAYWILEYGGHDKKGTSQKFISFNEINEDNLAEYVSLGGGIYVTAPADMTTSFNEVPNSNGVKAKDLFKDTKDYISGWRALDEDGNPVRGYEIDFDTLKNNKTDKGEAFNKDDIYFYAVVAGKATDAVTVKSIAPVVYAGKKHLTDDIAVNKRNYGTATYDLGLYVHDDEKNYNLQLNKDYTVTMKNNTNASVKYAGDGTAADVVQLFAEKKRPQVVIKGKGYYKGLKTTVYFDILPANLNAVLTEDGNFGTDTGSVDTTYEGFYKLNKNGKGFKYKNKVTYLQDNWVKNAWKTKKYTLKAKKDYTETLYKYTVEDGKEFYTAADPKTVTEKGDYIFCLNGTGNYCGEVDSALIKLYDNSAIFLSDLGFKGKNVSYTGNTVSVDSTGFNVKGTKKKGAVNGKKLKYGTDYTAAIDEGYLSETQAEQFKNKMAVAAGTYFVDVAVSPALADKVIDDGKLVAVKIKPKKLSAKKFSTNWGKKGKDYTGHDDEVTVTYPTGLTKDKDFYSFPTSFTSNYYDANPDWDDVHDTLADPDDPDAYLGGATPLECLTVYDDTCYSAGSFEWKYTGKGADGVTYNYSLVCKDGDSVDHNADPGEYSIIILGKGKYDGSVAAVKYKRNSKKIKDTKITVSAIECNLNGTYPVVKMQIENAKGEKKEVELNTLGSPVADNFAYVDPKTFTTKYHYTLKWSNNKKAGSKAGVVVVGDKEAEYTGSAKKVTFTINQATVKEISEFDDSYALTRAEKAGKFFATVEDTVATRNGGFKEPKVVLYQFDMNGRYTTAAKLKKDYTFTYGKATSNNTISINNATNASKSNLKIEKAPLAVKNAVFSVYDKKAKAKDFEVTLSPNFISDPYGDPKDAPYDEKKKTVVYTGSEIIPQIMSVTVGGYKLVTQEEYDAMTAEQKKSVDGLYELVIPGNHINVGTVKYEIQIKYLEGKPYNIGGSQTYTYKIVPQANNNLILSK